MTLMLICTLLWKNIHKDSITTFIRLQCTSSWIGIMNYNRVKTVDWTHLAKSMALTKYFGIGKGRSGAFSWWDVLPLPGTLVSARKVLRRPRSQRIFALRQSFKYSKGLPKSQLRVMWYRCCWDRRGHSRHVHGFLFCTGSSEHISKFPMHLLHTFLAPMQTSKVQQNLAVMTSHCLNGNHIQMIK